MSGRSDPRARKLLPEALAEESPLITGLSAPSRRPFRALGSSPLNRNKIDEEGGEDGCSARDIRRCERVLIGVSPFSDTNQRSALKR
jgi:hypothetical protein